MAKWIELNTGELVNLDMIYNIRKYNERRYSGETYNIEYYCNGDVVSEIYNSENDRDKRFEEVRAILIGSDEK